MDDTIKDVSLLLIIWFTELITTCVSDKILNKQICVAIRLVIGSFINIIELSVIYSNSSNSILLNVVIGILVLTITFFIIFSTYLIILFKDQTKKVNKKCNLTLSVCFKIINISVAIIIIVAFYFKYQEKVDKSFMGRLFFAYGVCDLALSFLSIFNHVLKSFCIRLICRHKNEHVNDPELSDELKETKTNLFYSFCCCFHLLACSIPALIYTKKSMFSKAKRLNKIFELFFIATNVSLTIVASIFLCLTLFRFPSNCAELNRLPIFGSIDKGQIYLFQDLTNATLVYCEKNSMLIMAKYPDFNYLTQLNTEDFNANFSLYQNGFDIGDIGEININNRNYWIGLKNLYQLLEQKDTRLKVYLSNENSSYYPVTIEFDYFKIKDESQGYELILRNMSSNKVNLSDIDTFHSGMKFSTKDLDRDNETTLNCASKYRGGWWFNNCFTFCPTCSSVTFNETGLLLNYKYIKMYIE